MGRRLRVFVSSTMNELANERKAVCDRLADLNFEPVNAEGWASRPATSSETIRAEIESSDLFLLILGTDYGWCPPDGRGPESVTHLEFHQAQDLGLPVFPFLKGLSYESSSRSREARKRDAFRKEVENWEGGYFRGAQFDLAEDLAREVGRALLQFLTDEFQRSRLSQRAPVAARALARLTSSSVAQPVAPYVAPPELSDAVRSGRAVLLAGAGLSLAAGMPSADAVAERLTQELTGLDSRFAGGPADTLARTISNLEAVGDRDSVVRVLRTLLAPPQNATPTSAHRAAVHLFDRIVTTNYDNLFEQAATSERTGHIVLNEDSQADLSQKVIVKLHGSLDAPTSLILSEHDLATLDVTRRHLYMAVVAMLQASSTVIVGHSLRDPSVLRLLAEAGTKLHGFYVAKPLSPFTRARVSREWNLLGLDVEAGRCLDSLLLSRSHMDSSTPFVANGADYGIVVALPEERDAVISVLGNCMKVAGKGADIHDYHVGTVDCTDGTRQAVAVVLALQMGQHGGQAAASALNARWAPRHLMLVGIAGGFRDRKVRRGDVLVPREIRYYPPGKVLDDTYVWREQAYRTSAFLGARVDEIDPDWAARIGVARPDELGSARAKSAPSVKTAIPKIRRGELLSGEEVWASTRDGRVQAVLEHLPEVEGIEMEAGGFAFAAHALTNNVDALVVKGVSDYANRKKNDAWRRYAAAAAATVAIDIVRLSGGRGALQH